MAISSVGDMLNFFTSSRNTTALKTSLNGLSQELATGQARDLTSHLGASQSDLNRIDRQLALLNQGSVANSETSKTLEVMQLAIDSTETQRETTTSALLAIGSFSSTAQMELAADTARAGFEQMVSALNTRLADRSLFGGNDTLSSPLVDAETMLAELKTAVSGTTSVGDAQAIINNWFSAPGGGFETIGYQGDASGTLSRFSDQDKSVNIDVRADDAEFRDVMAAYALGALATDTGLSLSNVDRSTLLQTAGTELLTGGRALADVQSKLGYLQGQVEADKANISAREAAFSISRNELVQVDPFETASRLEQVQLQLETQFTLTARLSRLSLMEYLR